MMRRWLMLNIVLAVIVLGLGIQIVRTWARTLPPIEVRAPGKVAETPPRSEGGKRGKRAQADKGAAQTPQTMVASIVNKDLFDPSRTKPSEAVVAAPQHVTEPPPGISLVGVRAFGKDREGFILDATQSNTQRRIRPGDTVGSFTVKSIGQRSVVLVSAANDTVTLSLEVEKSKNPTAPPARPGRPQAAAAAAAAASPAAGVTTGASPAAGVGGAPKPPVTAAGTAAAPPPPPVPGAPPVPPAPGVTPTTLPKRPPSPNLPEGVRKKLEQMKGLNKR